GAASFQPSCSAWAQDGPPRRSPTTTLSLLSRRFSAWARPWLPYPTTAMRFPSRARGFASFSQNILAMCFSPWNLYPALVTAPSDADETSFAYLAITPLV